MLGRYRFSPVENLFYIGGREPGGYHEGDIERWIVETEADEGNIGEIEIEMKMNFRSGSGPRRGGEVYPMLIPALERRSRCR